mmetsp:Transcript_24466/g.34498  ORF Transcript_24466/g.34498 Transcript_24466/m.34498 type:complete len:212 (-) Transcript_24466:4157-4792(-)
MIHPKRQWGLASTFLIQVQVLLHAGLTLTPMNGVFSILTNGLCFILEILKLTLITRKIPLQPSQSRILLLEIWKTELPSLCQVGILMNAFKIPRDCLIISGIGETRLPSMTSPRRFRGLRWLLNSAPSSLQMLLPISLKFVQAPTRYPTILQKDISIGFKRVVTPVKWVLNLWIRMATAGIKRTESGTPFQLLEQISFVRESLGCSLPYLL